MTAWRIYYSDGTTISSEDATPWSIERREDVQVIAQEDAEHNWVTLSGFGLYVWDVRGDEVKWWGCEDKFGFGWYLRQPGYKCVLFGTWIDNKTFREIFDRARQEFGNKEAFEPGERHP